MDESLQSLPGVGPATERDLHSLGIRRVDQLRRADPEDLFDRLQELHGGRLDRCVLDVPRAAVSCARAEEFRPELAAWWRFKDGAAGHTALARPGEEP